MHMKNKFFVRVMVIILILAMIIPSVAYALIYMLGGVREKLWWVFPAAWTAPLPPFY